MKFKEYIFHFNLIKIKAVLPLPAEEVQPAIGTVDAVLLCHHWIRPLHVNICLIQLSYQIWPQKTTEGSPDCWANHWYNPPHSQRTVLIKSERKGWQNHSGHLTSSTLILWIVTIWSMLQSSEHQNDQTQTLFLSPSNPSHENLTLNMEHTTLLYNYLFTILMFSFQICTCQTSHIIVCFVFCHFVHCLFIYCSFVVCVLSLSFCCTVELLSL